MSENKKPYTPPAPLESGEYVGRLKKAALEPFKNGNGKRIAMKFEVDNGEEKRVIFHDLTTKHKTSKAAMEIGRKGADLFLKAVGLENGLADVEEDMTSVMDYVDTDLILYLGQEAASEYVDKEGVTRMSNPRNKVLSFKKR